MKVDDKIIRYSMNIMITVTLGDKLSQRKYELLDPYIFDLYDIEHISFYHIK